MSAAATAPAHPRIATRGFIRVPTSLIENQAAFTRAEMALALIVLRRSSGNDNVAVMVSDENWKAWTGLGPRLKEYAIAGLRQKCLNVSGRGDKARYSFARTKWETFVRQSGHARPRTIGRKAGVIPKAGARVHPECRERGCAMLQSASGGELLVFPTQNAQPVAQPDDVRGCGAIGVSSDSPMVESPLSPSALAQPVARSDPEEQTAWPLALTEARRYFPLVEPAFLDTLARSVADKVPGTKKTPVTDPELAKAITTAFIPKSNYQRSEGLFLDTVPSAVRFLRRSTSENPRSHAAHGGNIEMGRPVETIARMFEDGDPRFQEYASDVRMLGESLKQAQTTEQIQSTVTAIETLCDVIGAKALRELTDDQATEINRRVERDVLPYRSMSEDQRNQLRQRLRRRLALTALSLPDVWALV